VAADAAKAGLIVELTGYAGMVSSVVCI